MDSSGGHALDGGWIESGEFTFPHPLLSEHAQAGHGIPPDMVVVVSADAKEFHVAACEYIHNKDNERTLTVRETELGGVRSVRAVHAEVPGDNIYWTCCAGVGRQCSR
jgi:hypothetical protein